MRKILIIAFVLIAIITFGCNKKSEKYVLKHYTKNMGGVRYWHGEYATPPHIYTGSGGDSVSTMFDTFEIKIINNTTIDIKGRNLYFNELNNAEGYIEFYLSVNERTQSWRIEQLFYYFKTDSMTYYVTQNHQWEPYNFTINTP